MPLIPTLKSTGVSLLTPVCAFATRHCRGPIRDLFWRRICSPYLKWRDNPFIIRTKWGFQFAGNSVDEIPMRIYYFGVWEPTITAWIHSLRLTGRSFIDVGANLGWYSLLASRCVGSQGRVVAIEASPSMFAGLERNVTINRATNVRLLNVAAWREFDELDLFPGPASESGTTTVSPSFARKRRYGAAGKVNAAPLSALLSHEEIATAAVVKIDVEGAEYQVIEGMGDIINLFPNDIKIILELTPNDRGSSAGALRLFRDAGFRPYLIPNEYSDEFYLSECSYRPSELDGEIDKQVDVILTRDTNACDL